MNLTTLHSMLEYGQARSGDILLYRGTGFIGSAIQWFTNQPFSHASQLFNVDDDWLVAESDLELDCFKILRNGPMIRRLDAALAEEGNTLMHLCRWISPLTQSSVLEMLGWWNQAVSVGVGYSVDQIYRFATALPPIHFYTSAWGRWLPWANWRLRRLRGFLDTDDGAEVCSTAVAHAVQAAGLFDGEPDETTPGDIAAWPGIELVELP